MPSLKQRPWWLFFITKGAWITISPNIYYPAGTDPGLFPNVVVHEETHLKQQAAMGRNRWLLRYICHKSFRLSQEAEAYAVEVAWDRRYSTPDYAKEDEEASAEALASSNYLWAASTPEQAKALIEADIAQLPPTP